MSTTPIDRSRRHRFLSVDFVTARTLDECRDCLLRCEHLPGQSLSLQEDNSFSIRRTVGDDEPAEVRFWGTLETVPRGTWVWGTVIQAAEAGRRGTVFVVFAAAILVALLVDALLRGSLGTMLLWALVLVALGIVVFLAWRRRYRYALQIINWMYDMLYVSPDRP
jgi:Flp pilus assembly protein TadB